MVPVFVTLPGLCFGGAALQHSVRRVHHQLELEQMATVADGAPLYETAGESFTTTYRKLPQAAGCIAPERDHSNLISRPGC